MRSRSRDSRAAVAASAGPPAELSRWSRLGVAVLGALLGGLAGAFLVVGITLLLKAGIDYASSQNLAFIVVVPLLGLAAAVLALHGHGTTATEEEARDNEWKAFPPDAVRADISADVVETAGEEERFPWRWAPLRAAAIVTTVGSGAAMGTEAPAAYLGVAAGACLGDRGRRWRRLLRPAALAGGAAGVSALMGIALVGTAFMLELGRRRRAPLSAERVIAALIGGFIGWGVDTVLGLGLIRLVVPTESPGTLARATLTAILVGTASGAITAVTGWMIYRAKKWRRATPVVRLVIGGLATVMLILVLAGIAVPSAAVGPGGGAILWAQTVDPRPLTLLAVCLLRAALTAAAVAAGGCGGVFVPFIAVGDLAGRMFAPGLGVETDLAGAAGAAGGITGGYRLPVTAAAMVLGLGGPSRAVLTCLATVVVAVVAGRATRAAMDKLTGILASEGSAPAH